MRVADLSAAVVEQIKSCRYNNIVGKHEGPETWAFMLDYAEFFEIAGRSILFPIDKEQHPFITIFRCIVGSDDAVLTIFLKDTLYTRVNDSDDEMFSAGRLAVCEKFPGQDFYLATVYHEWFIIDNG